jgi:hypothetical protein
MKRIGALLIASLAACSGPSEPAGLRILTQVVVVEGDSQLGIVHAPLGKAVAVRVLDDQDKPVAGQAVVWKIVKGGGSVFAGFGLTNDAGIAQEQWTLGDTAGIQLLEARAIDSLGKPIVFGTLTATAQPGPMTYQGFNGLRRVWVPADSDYVLPAVARDAYGNALPVAITTLDQDAPKANGAVRVDRPAVRRYVVASDTFYLHVRWPSPIRYAYTSHPGGVLRVDTGSVAFEKVDTTSTAGCSSGPGFVIWHRGNASTANFAEYDCELQPSSPRLFAQRVSAAWGLNVVSLSLTYITSSTWVFKETATDSLVIYR